MLFAPETHAHLSSIFQPRSSYGSNWAQSKSQLNCVNRPQGVNCHEKMLSCYRGKLSHRTVKFARLPCSQEKPAALSAPTNICVSEPCLEQPEPSAASHRATTWSSGVEHFQDTSGPWPQILTLHWFVAGEVKLMLLGLLPSRHLLGLKLNYPNPSKYLKSHRQEMRICFS